MNLHMGSQARLRIIAMAAYITLERPVTVKCLLMLFETLMGQELHLATRALVFLLHPLTV